MTAEARQPTNTHGHLGGSHDFALERYKHVLGAQVRLDENAQTSFKMFQGIVTAILAAISLVVLQAHKWPFHQEAAIAIVKTTALLTALTGATFLAIMIGNMFSWFDLRREEQHLTNQFANLVDRTSPSFRNAWRWKEAYLTLMAIMWTAATVWLFLNPYLQILANS